MFEFRHFNRVMIELGVEAEREVFDLLFELYSEPSRFYHDQSHVSECLSHFQSYRSRAERPGEIEAAIWFHDAIYDTTASDNEEKSAELAEHHLKRAKVETGAISRIVEMILATKSHEVSSQDSMLMVDIDLGVLGAPPDAFEEYDLNIRKEYHWVPTEIYQKGRVQVLKSFYDREVIYHTDQIRMRYEEQARENLLSKINALDA